MESFTSNNEKISGYRVYKRKRKYTSSEERKLYPAEALSGNSKYSKVKADDHISAGADGSGMENLGGAAISDADICGTMVRQTPNEVKHDKLLILREVLQKSIEELDKPKENNNEGKDRMQRPNPVYTQSGQAHREKYAKLRARQKERLALRNTSKTALSSSRLAGPKQSSDLQIVKYGDSFPFNALSHNWNGADAQGSSSMSLKAKDISIPNTPLHKMNDSASGFASSTSLHKNIDPMTSRRPSGFLKRNTGMNDWSELELDALWVGVRRYGQGNWETMLADPALGFFKNRTPEDLSARWNTELLKIFPSPEPTSSLPSTKLDTPITPLSVSFGYTNVQAHVTSFCSYQTGSSSGVSHSFQKAAIASDPQLPSNVNLEPMMSELLFQTLNQKADQRMNVRNMRMQALQAPVADIATMRNS